jgi:RHS repeat-associated protein
MGCYDVTHVYDPVGNRTLKLDGGSRTTSVYNGVNRIVYSQDGTGRTTITYDVDGNLTKEVKPSGQITTSVWDAENMNGAVLLPDTTRVTYTYNGNHQRVRKDAAGGTRKYVYNLENLLTETDVSNVTQAVYTLEPVQYGNLVSQRQLVGASWNAIYYHYDALGSTDSLSDSMAVVSDTYTYTAFGKLQASTGTTTNLFTWAGELGYVRDTETGEYGLRVRQYQPDKARFKSQDPVGFVPDPISLYRYVGNNAVTAVDPSGLEGKLCPKALPSSPTLNNRTAPLDDLIRDLVAEEFCERRKCNRPPTSGMPSLPPRTSCIPRFGPRTPYPFPTRFGGPADLWERTGEALCELGIAGLDVGTSVTPLVSDIRDTVEFVTREDVITGEKLDDIARLITLIGLVIPFIPAKWLRVIRESVEVTWRWLKTSLRNAPGYLAERARRLLAQLGELRKKLDGAISKADNAEKSLGDFDCRRPRYQPGAEIDELIDPIDNIPTKPKGGDLSPDAPTIPLKPTTAVGELASLGALEGKSGAEISARLTADGFTSVTAKNGGTIWTKAMPDGNTAVVRIDPPMIRPKPKGFADEVPHIHKEVVPTNKVKNGNYAPKDATKLDDSCNPSTDPGKTHIPGGQ